MIYDIGQGSGIICIKIWLYASAFAFLKVEKPELYEEVRSILKKHTFDEDPERFREFYLNPSEYRKNHHG
jgi:hypothetical protein